jgi:hypothetical protein
MTCKDIDYVKRYRDRAREMRALSEIMTHPKTKATMLRLARGYDDKADRVLERPAHLTPDFYKRISRMGNEARSRKLDGANTESR